MKPNPGDIFCVYNEMLNQYTACQVTGLREKGAVVLTLDWTGDAPLTPEELPALRPFRPTYMFCSGGYELVNVPPEPPANYIHCGNIPPIVEEDSCSYSGWGGGYAIARQRWWDSIPEDRRRAFKEAAASRAEITVGGRPVKRNLSHLRDTCTPFGDAGELRELKCLTALDCKEWHPGLLEYARETPFLLELRLENHGRKRLDLRGTSVQRLIIDLAGVEELWLGEQTGSLCLTTGAGADCVIHTPAAGEGLGIDFEGTVQAHPELPRLTSVYCHGVEELNLAWLREQYPGLRTLRLWGKPGYLRNFRELKHFSALENFTTVDLFGFTGADIPRPEELPRLLWFWMSSLPEDAARTAKKLYKKREGLDLWIQKARKPEWLAENLNNPFRHWDGMEGVPASSAKKAAALYKTLRKELLRLCAGQPEDSMTQAKAAVAAFVKPFNRMRFIETEEREDIYAALCGLLDQLPGGVLDREALLEVFEDERDF